MAGPGTPQSLLFFLDSTAIANGANLPAQQCWTSPRILAEFQPGGATRRRLDQLLAAGLRVEDAATNALKTVRDAATKAGSLGRLSEADVEILALAVAHRDQGWLITDDYTLADVAKRLDVRVQGVAQGGIVATKDWRPRCTGCGRSFDTMTKGEICPVCGSPVALKPKRA